MSGFLAVTVALGITSACGGDHSSPLSPTPLAAPSRPSAGAAASSALSAAIVAVSPSQGPASGGTPITITGDDFAQGAIVLLDGLPALNVVVLTTTTIVAVAPTHAEGAVDVIVTNPDGEPVILAGGYTYTTGPSVAPILETVSPASGPATGGTEIVISGRGFAEGATVNLGAWPAMNVVLLSDTTVTATTSPHGEGTFDVTVINPDGHFGTLPGAYTYVAAQPLPDLVVTIMPSGVSPKELQVPVGSRVTFVNNNSRAHDLESDPHPFHIDCPAINAVGFIRPGESKQTGVFGVERTCSYHDHLQDTNRALRGTIVVVPVPAATGIR
jgi:plastocyanin